MLSDVKIRALKAREKPYKLADGGGLYLLVNPNGSRLWRLKYRFLGKEKLLALGAYPVTSLAEAREMSLAAKRALKDGRDPAIEKQRQTMQAAIAAADTFEAITREWHGKNESKWADRHGRKILESLELHIFPRIGSWGIAQISAADLLPILQGIEDTASIETAKRLLQRITAIFVYAIATQRAKHNPAAGLSGALKPLIQGNRPALTDLDELRAMLAKAEAEPAYPVTRLGMRLLALTVLRPSEMRQAELVEFDAIDPALPIWRVPAERMKMRGEHWVPLSRQAIEVINALRPLAGRGKLLLPSQRHHHKPLSENALGYLLNRIGYKGRHVPHGWRASFSTIMNERFRADREVIDLMLAHQPKGVSASEAAYNRSLHIERRAELAQIWADLLLKDFPPAAMLANGPRR